MILARRSYVYRCKTNFMFLIVNPMSRILFTSALSLLLLQSVFSQAVNLQGVIRDESTGYPLPQTSVTVYDEAMKVSLAHAYTDEEGRYNISAPGKAMLRIVADKATYFERDSVFALSGNSMSIDLALAHKPGYMFDITLFDKAFDQNPINTLRDSKVEIYNNTTREQVLTIENLPKASFNFAFAEGNHYTMLIRKPGYLNRRIEVYVNVNGCILCVDGMGIREPDLVPLMSHNNEIGHFLGSVELDSIEIGKRFTLNNIYYDFDKWDIRPEAAKTLDKLAVFLKDNPSIKVELGSHTDARGGDDYNLTLSDHRAEAAVQYLVDEQGLNPDIITFKGYGETQLINRCDDGVACSETKHQFNRRTEIKITGILNEDPLWKRSLKEIIEDKDLYRKVIEQEKKAKTYSKAK